MFRLGTSSEKKDPNQLFPIKSNLKKKPLVIENSMSVIINIDSHIIQLLHDLKCQGMDPIYADIAREVYTNCYIQ